MTAPIARDPIEAPSLVAALGDSALRRASSSAIFQRGMSYASSGAVEVRSEELGDTPTIHATVNGTEPYSTEVWVHDGEVGGSCDCASARDGWFCKHQVALALVWRGHLGGAAPAIDEEARRKVQASARRARTAQDRRQALHDFLHSRSAATLADRLLDFADRDHEIARELQQWRKVSEAPQEAADLKALVTEIMSPRRDFLSWDECHGYVHRAEAVLPLLARTRERDPSGAMALSLHAMRRGWAALEQSDDSNGDIGGLIQGIGAEWVAALKQAGPQPAAFGDTYLQLLLDDPFGCFETEAAEMAMGEAALRRYRQALAARWREAKDAVLAAKAEHAAMVAKATTSRKRPPHFERDTERDVQLWTLEGMYLEQLEAEGDIEGALAVMREDMSEPGSYHQMTEFLERHGRCARPLPARNAAARRSPPIPGCRRTCCAATNATAGSKRRSACDDGDSTKVPASSGTTTCSRPVLPRDETAMHCEPSCSRHWSRARKRAWRRSRLGRLCMAAPMESMPDNGMSLSGPRCCARSTVGKKRLRWSGRRPSAATVSSQDWRDGSIRSTSCIESIC